MLYLLHSKICSIFEVQNNYVLLLIQAGGIELMDVHMSRIMGKPTICICENKGADQLRGYREADQRLCFRYLDSTIPPLLNSKISSF